MKVALYARVSTKDKDQNPEVQLDAMREYCKRMGWEVTKEYVDHASAVDLKHRTAWAQFLKDASYRTCDMLLVWKLARAFRSNIHAHTMAERLKRYGVDFRSYTEPVIDTSTPMGYLLFAVFAACAEMDREQLRENVSAGMEHAKKYGTKSGLPIGRPRRAVTFNNVCKALVFGKGNYSAAARKLSEELEKKVGAGFVHNRLKREADVRGVPMEEFKRQVINGEVTGKEED